MTDLAEFVYARLDSHHVRSEVLRGLAIVMRKMDLPDVADHVDGVVATMRREVEAMRRIVDEYERLSSTPGARVLSSATPQMSTLHGLEAATCFLASIWDTDPDYREQWT